MCLLCGLSFLGWSQKDSQDGKVWLDGFARTFFSRDALPPNSEDTLSSRSSAQGYNLLDLNTHVNPNEDVEVFAQVRIRNEFGGFFGQGTSVEVRQLRASGVLRDRVRFGVGDLFLRQSTFTLSAPDHEGTDPWGKAFRNYTDIVDYENFFVDDRWRMQGLQAGTTFRFDRGLRTLGCDGFVTRPRGSQALSETAYAPDQLFTGVSLVAEITKDWSMQAHHSNFFEAPLTGTQTTTIGNPVWHVKAIRNFSSEGGQWQWTGDVGWSQRIWSHHDPEVLDLDSVASSSDGLFWTAAAAWTAPDSSWRVEGGWRHVEPDFRSAGAQTKRMSYGSDQMAQVYPMLGNGQSLRPFGMFDVLSDPTRGNQLLQGTLMPFHPVYGNVMPYGAATPNRQGGWMSAQTLSSARSTQWKLEGGLHTEIVGQGTVEKRKFGTLGMGASGDLGEWLGSGRSWTWSVYERLEHTRRGGNDIESIQLTSSHLTMSSAFSLADDLFLQASVKHVMGEGQEYLNVRDELGGLVNYERVEYDVKDWMAMGGLTYQFSDHVYTSVQWGSWGVFNQAMEANGVNARQFMVVLSAEL